MAKLTHEDILAYLEEATILELNDLVSAIEEKFGVTAAAPVAAAPAAEAAEAAGQSYGRCGSGKWFISKAAGICQQWRGTRHTFGLLTSAGCFYCLLPRTLTLEVPSGG